MCTKKMCWKNKHLLLFSDVSIVPAFGGVHQILRQVPLTRHHDFYFIWLIQPCYPSACFLLFFYSGTIEEENSIPVEIIWLSAKGIRRLRNWKHPKHRFMFPHLFSGSLKFFCVPLNNHVTNSISSSSSILMINTDAFGPKLFRLSRHFCLFKDFFFFLSTLHLCPCELLCNFWAENNPACSLFCF